MIHSAMTKTYAADVTIVGAGPVGSALALALAQGGLSVLLVDYQASGSKTPTLRDGRGYALSLATTRMLEVLGVWNDVKDDASPINDIWVNEDKSPFFLHFDHKDVSTYPMGYLVESDPLLAALRDRVTGEPQITFLSGERAIAFKDHQNAIALTLESGSKITSSILIASDGKASTLRSLAGIQTFDWDYDQTAIVCRVAHEKPHDQIAFEVFQPAGPLAFLPLSGNVSSLVWTEKPSVATLLLSMDETAFAAHLYNRFPHLGPLKVLTPRRAFPLKALLAKSFVQGRLALVGDAAHGMHPVAGQGLNVGFKDVAVLAELIVTHHRLGLDIGRPEVLSVYHRKRFTESLSFLAATHSLVRLFSNSIPPLRLVRTFGLGLVNCLPFLKGFFTKRAMGLSDPTPKLMLGERL